MKNETKIFDVNRTVWRWATCTLMPLPNVGHEAATVMCVCVACLLQPFDLCKIREANKFIPFLNQFSVSLLRCCGYVICHSYVINTNRDGHSRRRILSRYCSIDSKCRLVNIGIFNRKSLPCPMPIAHAHRIQSPKSES